MTNNISPVKKMDDMDGMDGMDSLLKFQLSRIVFHDRLFSQNSQASQYSQNFHSQMESI